MIVVPQLGEDLLVYEGHNSGFYRPDRLLAAATLAPLNVRAMIREFRPQVVMSFLKGMGLLTYAVTRSLPRAERPRWILREGNNTDAVIEDELSSQAARRLIKGLTRRAYRRSRRLPRQLARDGARAAAAARGSTPRACG